MSLSPQIRLKQKQSLRLTQTMRQSIELMQLSRLEVEKLIEHEKQENPLLELDNEYGRVDIEQISEQISDVREALSSPEATESLDKDSDYDNEFDSEPSAYYFRSTELVDAGSVIEATAHFKQSAYGELIEQIRLSFKKPAQRAIAQFWLAQLDDNGRLSQTAFNHAKNRGLSDDDLEFLLARLQQLEPVGLFARNLKECLKAQLIDSDEWDLLWLDIFDNMDKVAKGQMELLQKRLKLDKNTLMQRIYRLKELSPTVAWKVEEVVENVIIADLRIFRDDMGSLQIELNEDAFSDVVMQAVESNQSIDLKKDDWIKAKEQRGKFLIRILARRAESILKLGEIILQKQVMFFEKDARYLLPLTMRNIADEMGLHESTVSRLVRGKYLEFEGQTTELRWFFSAGRIKTSHSSDVSAISVQEHIKNIIAGEPPKKPYSDEKLTQILKEKHGLEIARRTVAKYRENIQIPSSSQRKQQYLYL